MGRRILTQKTMREVRTRVVFCYLCGASLPPRRLPGYRENVLGEHVIPRSLLGTPPVEVKDRWAVELNVHRACEQRHKQEGDHFVRLLHSIHLNPPEEWAKTGHIRRTGVRPTIAIDSDRRLAVPALSGITPMLTAVWRWVTGVHAALYGTPLDAGDHWSRVLPPVPAFGDDAQGVPLEICEEHSRLIMQVLQIAVRRDKWDGIVAWGTAVDFRCVWWKRPHNRRKPPWVCFWALIVPGVIDWSRQVLPGGMERPWHGSFVCQEAPPACSVLSPEDFPAA